MKGRKMVELPFKDLSHEFLSNVFSDSLSKKPMNLLRTT